MLSQEFIKNQNCYLKLITELKSSKSTMKNPMVKTKLKSDTWFVRYDQFHKCGAKEGGVNVTISQKPAVSFQFNLHHCIFHSRFRGVWLHLQLHMTVLKFSIFHELMRTQIFSFVLAQYCVLIQIIFIPYLVPSKMAFSQI